ncbi:hypothetical protein [Kribbella sp. NBC_00662]|uniref:hypothetical protein n=1 Tax=Kribbella sp. NBC_00662 TaxID=2975969 RepID=UPI00352A5E90
MAQELLGVAGVGDDADGVGAAVLEVARVAEGLEGVGDRGDGRVVPDDRGGGSLGEQGFVAVVVAAADEDAALVCCLGGLVAGQVGIGVESGRADDLVQPVRRDRVDQRRDALVDVPCGFLGQFHARGCELACLPRGGVTGLYARPGEREPVPQRQRLADEPRGHHRRDPEHDTELGNRELRDLRTAFTTQHHGPLPPITGPAAEPHATGGRVEPVGVDLRMLQQPRVGLIGHHAMLDGRLQQVGRRKLTQISVEHVFDSTCSSLARQIGPTDETPCLQAERARPHHRVRSHGRGQPPMRGPVGHGRIPRSTWTQANVVQGVAEPPAATRLDEVTSRGGRTRGGW